MMDSNYHEFVELDPTGRYGRYNEILGKGASKTVYRAFDEYKGVEVAWNQVKLDDLLRRPEELERLYTEIHLLKTLRHKSIMRFCTSWVDTAMGNINFVTELFTSGTLRQYRQKHKKVHIKAVKHWCRQILRGIHYLHSHNPPIVHRDLKCDNIFINGNQGTVKIGDLGLAVCLRNSHSAHCVGTPEFMAPEVFDEDYNELADIYSFGMCVLEMITLEYPYSECSHPVQIYKKAISGTMPAALYRIKDHEVRQFIEKCLATASHRPSAKELLKDRFLRVDDQGAENWDGGIGEMCQTGRLPSYDLCSIGSLTTKEIANDLTYETKSENMREYEAEMDQVRRQHSGNPLDSNGSLVANEFAVDHLHQTKSESSQHPSFPDLQMRGIHLFNDHEKPFQNIAIKIEGTRREEGSIFLGLRITSQEGITKYIHFPFDIEFDTALRVAAEMVRELDITGHNVARIADMIDSEVAALVSKWQLGLETNLSDFPATAVCNSPASDDSVLHSTGSDVELCARCSGPDNCFTEGAQAVSAIQSEALDLSSQESNDIHSSVEGKQLNQTIDNEKEIQADNRTDSVPEQFLQASAVRCECSSTNASSYYDAKISKGMRWADSRDQMELRDVKNRQTDGISSNASPVPKSNRKPAAENGVTSCSSSCAPVQTFCEKLKKKFCIGKRFSFRRPNRRDLIPVTKSFDQPSSGYSYSNRTDSNHASSLENMFTAKSFYAGLHLPNSLL